ncbi:MAG: DUF3604 domain-containing protein [Halioglobus sp.]
MRWPLRALCAIAAFSVLAAVWVYLATSGFWGERQPRGEITPAARDAGFVHNKTQRQSGADAIPGADLPEKRILFGDLHVHSTYSFDAYNASLPMYRGDGSHPPGDACDFARFCSGLDFWSINDHAEGLTARQWQLTRDMVRQCNATAGDPAHPDMVTFLGWEWTQIGNTPQDHFGHKNVVLRDTSDGEVPRRPIASREQLFPGGEDPYGVLMRLTLLAAAGDAAQRQRYHDFIRFLTDRDRLALCAHNVPVRDLPADCQEVATTPTALFAKMDDWGFPYLTIPHGNTWGFYTPPLSSWDKQLAAHTDPVRHEPLIEVFSGHGNIEQYREWRAVRRDGDGKAYCPPPGRDYLPECWRAGEIIRQRCEQAGAPAAECERRAEATRANFILTKDSGHWTVPGTTLEDWLDAGQCRDCYMPAYNHRPTSSVQYGLAIRHFDKGSDGNTPKRFRWGMLGSSDVHTARPGTGYKEYKRRNMTDAMLGQLGPPAFLIEQEPLPDFVTLEQAGFSGPNFARFSSFFGTGGLVAVHATGRDRGAIWDALQRKEVYGTSGDRILLWFDLLQEDGDTRTPMGSSVLQQRAPQFEVTALGAFEQKPGCPADSLRALSQDRLASLCAGECYHPGDRRRRIERIEVVRIRPQVHAGEDVGELIEDPWRVLPCPEGEAACTVRFTDEAFSAGARDTVYYVRALQAPTPTINGAQLRCELDDDGQCLAVNPCRATEPTPFDDDCLSDAAERAWSSPIFVDFGSAAP